MIPARHTWRVSTAMLVLLAGCVPGIKGHEAEEEVERSVAEGNNGHDLGARGSGVNSRTATSGCGASLSSITCP